MPYSTFHIPEATGEIRWCWYDGIAAAAAFLSNSRCRWKVASGNYKPASITLAVFLRNSEEVNIQCGSNKNFRGRIKIKDNFF
jgi:hypothetical protein